MTCQGLGRSNVTQEYATLSCHLPRSGWGQTPLPALCPVRPGPARGRENTVCFLTDCWACLASLSEGIARLALGRLREERGSPYPALHIRTPNGGLATQVSTGISSFGNPTGMPKSTKQLAPQPACHHIPAFQNWQGDTCQAGREFWSDKVIRNLIDCWHNLKKS